MDDGDNETAVANTGIQSHGPGVRVLVVASREDLEIARGVEDLVGGQCLTREFPKPSGVERDAVVDAPESW